MEFLKELFSEPLTFEAFSKAITEKGIKLADLSSGEYVGKGKFDKACDELKSAKETISQITAELDGLKAAGASAEDYKTQLEALRKDVAAKEEKERADRAAAEKEASLKARYDSVCVGKDGKPLEWAHNAVKDSYFNRFAAAVVDKLNEGKSDADIFHELTKDDGAAFKGVQAITLLGGKSIDPHGISRDDFKKMNYAERLKIKTEQPEIYKAITENKE